MLINLIKIKNELNVETIDQYLRRVTTLIRRDEIRRGKWRLKNNRIETVRLTIQKHERDSMKLDNMKIKRKEIRKYFKYEKIEYIRRFCR